jgi:hypothetical protein
MPTSSEKVQTSLDNLKPLIKKLLDLRMDKRDIDAEIKSIEGTVKEAIADKGKMQLDNYVFECKTMGGRKTVDKDALEVFLAQHGKSYDDFTKVGAPFTQLRVDEAATVL